MQSKNLRAFGVLAALMLAPAASAKTLFVKAGGSIQAAINVAKDGDAIMVRPGTYRETVDFLGKAIHLRSERGPAMTIIDGFPYQGQVSRAVVRAVNYEQRDTILEGFTITGGTGEREMFYPLVFGGGLLAWSSSPTIINCVFEGNTSIEGTPGNPGYHGGGAITSFGNHPLVVNCVFDGNTADNGGAIYNHGFMTVVNCTFSGNEALGVGGAIFTTQFYGGYENHLDMRNCIVSGNTPALDAVAVDDEGAFNLISHSIVEDTDPMFMNAAAGDFRLAAGSPAIDAGHNWLLPRDGTNLDRDAGRSELLPLDLDGNPRAMQDPASADSGCGAGAVVDLGAYESRGAALLPILLGDLNGDGMVESKDLMLFTGSASDLGCLADLNVDGIVDDVDLAILLAEIQASLVP